MGENKALLPHPHGGHFVEHVARVVSAHADETVLLGHLPDAPAGVAHLVSLDDALPGGGPLAGLVSLLRAGGDGWRLLVACDLPLLNGATLQRLLDAATDDADAVAFRDDSDGKLHTCAALYHTRALGAAERELAGARRMQALLRRLRTTILIPTHPRETRSLTNVNSPAEYAALARDMDGAGAP